VITKTWEDKESPESSSTLHDHRVHFEQGQICSCPYLVAFIKKKIWMNGTGTHRLGT
jgi:hypothetical protein